MYVLRLILRGLSLLGFGMAAGLGMAAAAGSPFAVWAWWVLAAALLLLALQLVLAHFFAAGDAALTSRPVRAPARVGAGAATGGDIDLSAMIAAFPDPCVAVDRRGVVLASSPVTGPLFPTIVPGRPLSFAIRAPEFVEALDAVLNGGTGRTIVVTQRVPVERTFEIVVTPLGGDRRRGGLVVLRDLTGRQRVEQMRVDFIANASHELRTPLATVLGFIETLQGPARNDPVARDRFLVIMREQSLRMKRLIDDLLSLSRIEGHLHHAPTARIDVVDVASQIAESLRAMAGEAGVEIVFSAPETPVVVAGDRDELLRVFENLVENAVKYGESGKRVHIDVALRSMAGHAAGSTSVSAIAPVAGQPAALQADEAPDEVVVQVRDFGPGIAPEHLPRLTERFYRAGEAAGRGKVGSGLGLAIVKHIVMRHRGRLHFDSKPGEGTAFRVVLPLAGARRPL